MSHWIYSTEAIPDLELMGTAGYTPEWIMFNGITLPPIEAETWTKLPESFNTYRKFSWTSPKQNERVYIEDFGPMLTAQGSKWTKKGVIFLDHEPSAREKEKLEALSEDLNLKHRAEAIEFYEAERTNALARQGKYEASPYVDKCYELLKMEKPYSAKAFRAQRMPGEDAAQRISVAIAEGQKEAAKETAKAIAEVFKGVLGKPERKPEPEPEPVAVASETPAVPIFAARRPQK